MQLDDVMVPDKAGAFLSGCVEVDVLGDAAAITGTAKLKLRGVDSDSFLTISEGILDRGSAVLDIIDQEGQLNTTDGH